MKLEANAAPFGYTGVGVSQGSSEKEMLDNCACTTKLKVNANAMATNIVRYCTAQEIQFTTQ